MSGAPGEGSDSAPRAAAPFDRGVGTAADAIRVGIRPFASPAGQPRSRRATDVVVLVPALLGLAYLTVVYPPTSLELSLIRMLAAFPAWLEPLWELLADLAWVWALVILVATLVARRFSIALQTAAALAVAVAVGLVAARLGVGVWPGAGAVLDRTRDPDFPDIRLAATVAVVGTVSPHLVLPLRALSRWVVVLGVVGAAVSAAVTPGGALAAMLIGLVAASVVNLVAGTSAGRPGLGAVSAGLAQLGVEAQDLEEEPRQVAGVLRVGGIDAEGRRLLVKVYGRDAADTQRLARIWRRLWYRSEGPAIGASRLHAAEHEAFVTLLVRRASLVGLDVVTAGEAADGNVLLVLRGEATPLASLRHESADPALLAAAWAALGQLAELRIAHQHLDPTTVVAVDGDVGFVDFGSATVAPDEHQLQVDRAQLLATTAVLAGTPGAVDAAVLALGAEEVRSLLPYVQDAAFPARLRRALDEADVDVDELREQAAQSVGAEPPELVPLRRVSPRSAIQLGLLAFASYTVVSAASGVDWDEVRTSISDATWGWIALAFLVAQLPRLTQAISTMGSVPAQLPFVPVYAMQLATGYMNVALPSNLARLAVNIRFFQRQGLSPATSVAGGAIDSFASTIIQAVVLVLLLLFSGSSAGFELPLPSGDPTRLLWILTALVVVAVTTAVIVPRIRNGIADRVREWWPDVKATLAGLRASHKLAQLVLGSLATEVLFAVALGLFARAFGYDLTLAELLLINVSVSLLGALVPVPGNIGVAEFGLTVGLTGAGMTPEAALGAVFLYRLSTYYLPPLWGFVALRWLKRHRYL